MIDQLPSVKEVSAPDREALEALIAAGEPCVVRGLVNDWPLVQAGKQSFEAARDYLKAHEKGRPISVSLGPTTNDGRIFYNDDMTMNVQTGRARFSDVLDRMGQAEQIEPQPVMYIGSTDIHHYFNGLHEANHVDLGDRKPLASIWVGTKSRVAPHNDFPQNLACCAVGRRRFTIFPPDQFENLYIGPLDNTPAGRAISMVDLQNPNFETYPKFRTALDHAQVADLQAGDALYMPGLWWHAVEGLEAFNVLVNYWWRETPAYMGQPQDALNLAIMAIRDLPDDQKAYWRDLFNHYVFEKKDEDFDHIPDNAKGILGPMTPSAAASIRAYLLRALNQ